MMTAFSFLKTVSTLAILLFSMESNSYVKEHPISLYNIATGYFPYIDSGRENKYIRSDYTYNLRRNPKTAVWFPFLNSNGTYTFKNAAYGYCIEKYYQRGVVQNPCNIEKEMSGEGNVQQWNLQHLPNGAFLVQAAGNLSYCLTASGVDLEINQCDPNDLNHHWALIPPLSSDYEFHSDSTPM